MTTDRIALRSARTQGRMSGLALAANAASLLGLSRPGLAESPAIHSARPQGSIPNAGTAKVNPLGVPLSIRETAQLIGCSAWTVRQTHVPRGLPCFRSGPNSKLIFYRDQVIAWILQQQQKKGGNR